MRNLLFILFFLPVMAFAKDHGKGVYMDKYGRTTFYSGSRTTYGTHSGNISISQSGSGYTFTTYDTLSVTGSFGDVVITGISGVGNCVDGTGATVSNASYQQPEWLDLSNLTVLGFTYLNYYGTIRWKKNMHDFKLLNCTFRNTGTYRDQPIIAVDGPFITDMVFSGSKSQTYYNDSIVGCTFDGYQNIDVVRIGTPWGGGTEQNRSIALDWFVHGNTFKNITNTTTGFNVMSGTGQRLEYCHNHIDSIAANVGAGPRNHTASLLWYGTVSYHDNDDQNEYAQALRNYTLRWTALPGYDSAYTKIYRNRTKKKKSYSAYEGSHSGAGNRNSGNGFYPARIEVYNNTVDSTLANTYHAGGGPDDKYHGVIIDLVNFDTAIIKNNVIFKAEMDYALDSAAQNGYFYSEIGSAALHKNVSNNFSSRYALGKVQDSIDYIPSSTSPLRSAGTTKPWYIPVNDKFGNPGSDIGYANYVSAGSPPPCPVNSSPVNGSTSGSQTAQTVVWAASAGALSYNVNLNGSFVTNTASLSYGFTGLTANTTYTWRIDAVNASGTATGCTSWTFTTAAIPVPSCTTNSSPANASTIGTQTTATLIVNAASGAPTGYKYYIWVNGGSQPGSPTYTSASTSQAVTGLSAGIVYRFFATPYNGSGDAVGCATAYTIFTTAAAPVGSFYQNVIIKRK